MTNFSHPIVQCVQDKGNGVVLKVLVSEQPNKIIHHTQCCSPNGALVLQMIQGKNQHMSCFEPLRRNVFNKINYLEKFK